MMQEINLWLPDNSGWVSDVLVALGCIVGLFLWVLGARGNRNWLTLVFVFIGAVLGIYLGQRAGLSVANWAIASVMATAITRPASARIAVRRNDKDMTTLPIQQGLRGRCPPPLILRKLVKPRKRKGCHIRN